MGNAWINGEAATVREAVVEAARLLAASRFPLIAGLGTDVAGVRAAVALAERLGAAIDHMHSRVLFRDLDVMRDAGIMITTPNEARIRGELLLLVGGGLMVAWPELRQRLIDPPLAPEAGGASRRVMWLCPGRAEQARESIPNVESIGRDPADLPVVLAAFRARLAGRPVGKARLPAKTIDALAADLQAARFGVAVWAAAELDELTIEMLCGLIKDLNAKTRFTGLPLQTGDNAPGALQACGWLTGFPMRTGFGGRYPDHDPWRFDADRLVEAGEVDCALWISAYRATAPSWRRDVPMIALTTASTRFPRPPRVHIEVGTPGTDHDAVAYSAAVGALVAETATKPSETETVARVISEIGEVLAPTGG
jgi:formylmethanofuran dehydrogenase subunit B